MNSRIHISIVGSRDFVHRLSAALRARISSTEDGSITFSVGNMAEARMLVITERPHLLVFDIGFNTSREDIAWIRNLLSEVRDRFGKRLSTVLAVTTPAKFVFAGDLLFRDDASLEPSRLIDSLIIAPPPGIPSAPSIELQFLDCVEHALDIHGRTSNGENFLPALGEEVWAPSMCDPQSRDIWMRWVPRYARYVNENPLIVGPTGGGKTRMALALHALSGRKGPFVSITPRDFSSPELVQAELFGAVQGAYTGAVEKWGLVKKAEGGTLFVDELQSIDRDLQGKLITFIENKTYRRVGEAESHHADVRFIFASNRSVAELVSKESLRDDFAYRLERLQIELKPLRQRRLDIAAGACVALAKVMRERLEARTHESLSRPDAVALEGLNLKAYADLFSAPWPGNLRQVENAVARLIELADINAKTLIDEECTAEARGTLLGISAATSADIFEEAALQLALRAHQGSFSGISDCLADFSESIRSIALEVSGGEVGQAAQLIEDSPAALELFAAARSRQELGKAD